MTARSIVTRDLGVLLAPLVLVVLLVAAGLGCAGRSTHGHAPTSTSVTPVASVESADCRAPAIGEGDEKGLPAAKRYYASGFTCFEGKQFSIAARWFRLAYAAQRHPNVVYMIALSLDNGGEYRAAFEHYEKYLVMRPGDERVEHRRNQLERHLRLFCNPEHKASKTCVPPPLE